MEHTSALSPHKYMSGMSVDQKRLLHGTFTIQTIQLPDCSCLQNIGQQVQVLNWWGRGEGG